MDSLFYIMLSSKTTNSTLFTTAIAFVCVFVQELIEQPFIMCCKLHSLSDVDCRLQETPVQMLKKLFFFSVLMIVCPLATYFISKSLLFEGRCSPFLLMLESAYFCLFSLFLLPNCRLQILQFLSENNFCYI